MARVSTNIFGASDVSGANPTASVGLTAVNGVATTFLRSDGAPPLDQNISPVWTASHSHSYDAAGAIMEEWISTSNAAVGPLLSLYHNSASPASSDVVGGITIWGKDSGNNKTRYGAILCDVLTTTDTLEDSKLRFSTMVSGITTDVLKLASGAWIGNATGGDKGIGSFNAVAIYEDGTALSSKYALAASAALTSNPLSQFASTTSSQLAGVLSDENGSGKAIFASGILQIGSGKVLSAFNSLTFTGTDGSTLNVGTGGTLGTAAYTASTAYQPIDADLTDIGGLTKSGNALKILRVKSDESGYELAVAASGILDGDKGDITISGGVWTIDNDVVTYAKMQNVSATDKVLGRSSSGSGDIEEIACTATARSILDDASTTAVLATLGVPAFFQGVIWGLGIANNGSDATNDIDIAAGVAVDTTQAAFMAASALTKQLDAAWAVGTNQGMRDTGAISNNWWHIYCIRRSDTGVVDILASLSASAPTMPANYDQKCRIGAILRTGGAIKAFIQFNDDFIWKDPVLDVDVTTDTNSSTTRTLASVPTGVNVKAKIQLANIRSTAQPNTYVRNPSTTDTAPSITAAPLGTVRAQTTSGTGFEQTDIWTNTSAQICTRSDAASTTLKIATLGWTDPRGKF